MTLPRLTPLPRTASAWIPEIRVAQEDAAQTLPFGPLAGGAIEWEELFHLAPAMALKCRGMARTERNLKPAADEGLSSQVATTSQSPELKRFPAVCFAFAYLRGTLASGSYPRRT